MNDHILSLDEIKAYLKKEYLYVGVLIGFIILATVISSSFSRDSENYNRMFEMYGVSGWDALFAEMFRRETFFLVVSKALYPLGLGSVFLFLIHSVLSVSVKFYLINEHSKDKWISLAFFASYFFILHDSTQIRFGMAVAFVYIGLHFLADNKKLLFAIIVIFSAILFHVSSLTFIVMLFFTSKRSLGWLLVMICFAISLYLVDFRDYLLDIVGSAINYFEISGTVLNKLHHYIMSHNLDVHFGIFNWRVLLVYFCVIILFRYRVEFSKYEDLCYKSLLVSILFYILLKDVAEIQYRFSGLFGFSLVFLVPYIHQWLSEYMSKIKAYIILLSFFTVYLLKFALYDKMIII